MPEAAFVQLSCHLSFRQSLACFDPQTTSQDGSAGILEQAAAFYRSCHEHTYVVENTTGIGEDALPTPKLSKLEFQIMESLWAGGELSIREIQESFPSGQLPAYTTVQTTVYRMETKKVVRRVKKVGNFHVFEAVVTRNAAQRRILDDVLGYFGGQSRLVMAHLIESGKLSLDDVKDAERTLRKLAGKGKKE
jgi:predicted transcriptional regulator